MYMYIIHSYNNNPQYYIYIYNYDSNSNPKYYIRYKK